MEKSGSIIDGNAEHFLFTYSEEERQNNEVNKANAKKIYSPEFIPFYLDEVKKRGLQNSEGIIYGFIRFYMKNGGGRFYFNSQQLSEMIGISVGTIDNTISKFAKLGIIETSRKVKSGGGTLRFINAVYTVSDLIHRGGLISSTDELHIKKNKINNNKNLHIPANAEDDVFLFLSLSAGVAISSKQECTDLFGRYKTFDEIAGLVAVAKRRTADFGWADHPTTRALKGLDIYLKDNNGVQVRMDDNFEQDYDSRSDREEQLYYCRGNAQPHF